MTLPMRKPTPLQEISEAWGMLQERLAPEVKEAIRVVCCWESDLLSLNAADQLDTPSDIAIQQRFYEDGRKDGIRMIFEALCDGEYIAGQRKPIDAEIKERETDG